MLLRIKPLAEESNVLGGPPRDIYQYIMDRIPNYFESATYEKDGTSFESDAVDFTSLIGTTIKGLKIAVPNYYMGDAINKNVKKILEIQIKIE